MKKMKEPIREEMNKIADVTEKMEQRKLDDFRLKWKFEDLKGGK